MEFMDRRGRSLLVQFWLTVESFKNPLETVDSDSSGGEYEPLADATSAVTLREDLNMINDLYFSGPSVPPVLSFIPEKYIDAMRTYATTDSSTALERNARRSVMLAQRRVEREMDHDFESFKRSDLWFRAVGDLGPKQIANEPTVTPRPQLREHVSSSSTNLFASIVQGLTPDLSRGQMQGKPPPPSRADSSLSLSGSRYQSPLLMQSRFSTDSGHSSVVSTPGASRAVSSSQAQTSGNLEILMSSSADAGDDSPSRAPLFDESEDGQLLSADAEEAQRMAAIHAAVTDIIASETDTDPNQASASGDSLDRLKDGREAPEKAHRPPIFGDDQPVLSPTLEFDPDIDEDDDKVGPIQMAAPGDLQLPYEIARLEDRIASNKSQDVVLDTLIRKAELTGDAQELRVLRKSKSALEREMRQLVFQKSQYEQQDSASKLTPGKTKAVIVNSTSGQEDGKQVVRYLVEVQQPASGWVVARRYSEFLQMHQRLKERYALVRGLEFPGKHLVTSLSTQMVDSRRIALEKYLQVGGLFSS